MSFPVLPIPTPEQVEQARRAAGLNQAQAAALVSAAAKSPYKTWSSYEAPPDNERHRKMSPASWELFLLKTGQHPHLTLKEKADAAC